MQMIVSADEELDVVVLKAAQKGILHIRIGIRIAAEEAVKVILIDEIKRRHAWFRESSY